MKTVKVFRYVEDLDAFVLRSLALSYDLLFEEARQNNESIKDLLPEEYIQALEQRIQAIALDAIA